ncbi:formyltransferase family protein [Limisalsivibrio acetivorans]|uniref:formyltransferase family protein n=1 Tax=Limisalsivibrio acetivorans TaxID=1304888 RepID=UPI0003B35A5F|nr:formyltransferase family protein [Limisalsivibrio acetivorans]
MKIAVFCSDERNFALPAWRRVVEQLPPGYEITGIYMFPDRMGKRTGLQIPLWYLKTFGIIDFFLLGLYSLTEGFRGSFDSWERLANDSSIPVHKGGNPNNHDVVEWVKDNDVDVIFIMVGNILKHPIIHAPKLGVINNHAALLPSSKGVLPYIWNIVQSEPHGLTFHKVDEGIDTGEILAQKHLGRSYGSLIEFYRTVFSEYPSMALEAIERLKNEEYVPKDSSLPDTYYSFPERKDLSVFRKKGGKIVRLSDILGGWKVR